ncbi:MAG: site-specific integrase [Firmicutes bacterium]|nr:site-specific integrase [Bacillota bacterium]
MLGSLEKRGKNSWRLIVSCGMGPDGKQEKKTKTVSVDTPCLEKSCRGCDKLTRCKARKEADKLLAEFSLEVEKGLYIAPSKLTFKDFMERWIRDYGETNLAPKTLFRYKEMLDSRILPAMGHIPIEKLKPMHLLEFYKNLQEDGVREDGKPGGLSERTILHHHRLISAILQDAVDWEVIPSNPASKVKPPKVKKTQAPCYDEEQTARMLAALDTEPLKYKVMVVLALATGARRGELMGLEWQDVDFENSTIDIHQASQYLPGRGVFTKEPKTETSSRAIAIPPSVIALLKQYKAQQAEERLKVGDLWQESNRIFTTWDGRPMFPDTISNWFSKFLKRHGLPHIAFKNLRHTSGTLLIAEGVPLKNVSRRLGHSNISTTADIYAHALRSVDQAAAAKLDSLFTKHTGLQKQGQA